MSEERPRYTPLSRALILNALEDILAELKRLPPSREISLSITKLQEAILWLKEAINGG